jgi:hypothetical protein
MHTTQLEEFKRNIDSYIRRFDKDTYDLDLYFQITTSNKLTEEQIKKILCWKLGGKLKYDKLRKRHRKLIHKAIEKFPEINDFKKGKISKSDFDEVLRYISPKGPIIRIFLLHICKPKEYALFDQHVFRAFYYFKTGEIDKGLVTDSKAKKFYFEYCLFFTDLCEEFKGKYKPKEIDSALMVYGKDLKPHHFV